MVSIQPNSPTPWSGGVSESLGVVVVSYNSAADLPGCLEALAAADGIGGIAVVDNVSSDTSREIVRSFDAGGVELVEAPINDGFAGGCNRGFGKFAARV